MSRISSLKFLENLSPSAHRSYLVAVRAYLRAVKGANTTGIPESELEKLRLKGGQATKERRALVTIRKRVPETGDEVVKGFLDLRHAIVHGEVTLETYQSITEKLSAALNLPGKIVNSAVSEFRQESQF